MSEDRDPGVDETTPRRYIVIGAGAVGGTIAARLAQHEVQAIAVARGEHGRAISDHGLRLRTPDGDTLVHPKVWSSAEQARLDHGDVLVLAVKAQDAGAALAEWADAPLPDGTSAGETLPLLVCLNGVAGEDLAQRFFRRVFGVRVLAPCSHLEPGVVAAFFTGASAVLKMGRVPAAAATAEDQRLLTAIQRVWSAALLRVDLPSDVMPWKYSKLVANLGNAVDALVGDVGGAIDLVELTREEGRHVLRAAGISLVPDLEEVAENENRPGYAPLPGQPRPGSSSWQSLALGRGSIESDYLNGEIVRIARRIGLDAPINARLSRIASRVARLGSAHALVTFYWAGGGRWLVETLGPDLPARFADLAWVLAVIGVVKLACAAGPAVLDWLSWPAPKFWRPTCWAGAAVLVCWGGLNTIVGNLVLAGIVRPAGGFDRDAMVGHAWLWDPLFLAWGAALGLGMWASRRRAVGLSTESG
ncbi:hypothetical protein GCM10027449_01560 [Sinomonas notoginsengisoli]|uniref:2-dehydropantoate 2-reductase N-terminal domain-containing protein n=1 Tax=Sinomonas notoginsengisoli TaxID=1457311 RepID=UPI001F2AB4C2|nr:2-dehydropantoate 2-reductase N-terminal domain-containing protein [Sinomonas notoginsengisoli]